MGRTWPTCIRSRHRRAMTRRSASALALGLVGGACTYDPDDRCDVGEVLFSDIRCVCVEGLVQSANGCVPCGENEVAGAAGCVCADGYSRPSADAACQPQPAGQGDACDAQTPCADPAYDHCEPTSGASGYCTTTGCSSSVDCSGGYACDTTASPSVCRRPPIGAGQACASPADCEGTEALFCDAVVAHACLVMGCSLAPDDCFEGTECCDLSQFGVPAPVCVAAGACP